MKKETSKRLPAALQAQLKELAALKDADIDTSDAPEVSDWRGAERGRFYRPVKTQLTLRVDADVVDWFKRRAPSGRGYQTQMNQALREYVRRRSKSA